MRYDVIHDYRYYDLAPPPYGHFYAYVDDEVLLIAEATLSVVNFIGILNALSRY